MCGVQDYSLNLKDPNWKKNMCDAVAQFCLSFFERNKVQNRTNKLSSRSWRMMYSFSLKKTCRSGTLLGVVRIEQSPQYSWWNQSPVKKSWSFSAQKPIYFILSFWSTWTPHCHFWGTLGYKKTHPINKKAILFGDKQTTNFFEKKWAPSRAPPLVFGWFNKNPSHHHSNTTNSPLCISSSCARFWLITCPRRESARLANWNQRYPAWHMVVEATGTAKKTLHPGKLT